MNADTLEMGTKGSRPSRIADDISAVIDAKLMQVIVEAINPVIADGFALYEKTRAFYLGSVHRANRDHQLLFDRQAEEIFASMDILAERVKEMGGTPLRSISHSGEIQSVETYNVDSLSLSEMAEELIADNRRIAASLESARQIWGKQQILSMNILLMDVLEKTMNRIEQLRKAVIKYSVKQSRSR
jgi:starvation-inducible DNA-binding protein